MPGSDSPLDISHFKNYRDYLVYVIGLRPGKGRGAISEFALVLGVNKSFISNVINDKHAFSREQAYKMSHHLNLNELETEYFLELVDLEKSTSAKFRTRINEKLIRLKTKIRSGQGQSSSDTPLDDYEKSVFYSNWQYAAVHLLIGLQQKSHQSVKDVSARLNLDSKVTSQILNFLVKCGMAETNGKIYRPLITSTHLDPLSPFRIRHHMNWRLKAVESITHSKNADLHFTAPLRLNSEDRTNLHNALMQVIDETREILKSKKISDGEELVCLNVDFFEI